MKDYQHFSAIELALDEDFIRWAQIGAPEDDAFWQDWLRLHPDKSSVIDEAKKLVSTIQIRHPQVSDEMVRQEVNKLLQTISSPSLISVPPKSPTTTHSLPSKLTGTVAAAAVIFTIIGIRHWFMSDIPPSPKFAYSTQTARKHLIEKVNNTDKTDSLTLSDGSQVWLGPHSRISYSPGFDTAKARDIYLSGQADFEVTKHPLHPFRVISGEVITKVLGTRFCVRSFDADSTIQVIVRSGKVSVYTQTLEKPQEAGQNHQNDRSTPGSIILTCNQRLVYQKSAQVFRKSLLEQPSVITPGTSDEDMTYDDTPVQDVFTRLSKMYGIGITYDAELLKNCTVTADLKGEDFYKKLDLICRAIGATYEVIEGQVFIQSAGCQNTPSG